MKMPQTFSGKKNINAVVETPRGSRNKYTYKPEDDSFVLSKVLPSGTAFPMDFGFIPRSMGEDGDPLDVLVVSDFPCYPGAVVECRLLGVIEAEQKENGK